MVSSVSVTIHPSAFPRRMETDLVESLQTGQLNHKFLYEGASQTQKWLALHEAYSPARNDPDCGAIYDESFRDTIQGLAQPRVHLAGLGCGSGHKDTRLLELLKSAGKEIAYSPMDVSVGMVLTAWERALGLKPEQCNPVVLDLSTAANLPKFLEPFFSPNQLRLFTFFGMLPNFEPGHILPQLAQLVRHEDVLLLSANLAPEDDYNRGLGRILPLYDNELTRDWLLGFITNLGIEPGEGQFRFVIEDVPNHGLKRIVANYVFTKSRKIMVHGHDFTFSPGNSIRLFFSYRHTPELLAKLLAAHGLVITDQWITKSREEGVFLVTSSGPKKS